jgi:hypothetical protein
LKKDLGSKNPLKRLASAVKLRPWPSYFQSTYIIYLSVLRPLSVRFWKGTNAYVDLPEELISNCLPIQSALGPFLSGAWLRIAVNIFPRCDHAISYRDREFLILNSFKKQQRRELFWGAVGIELSIGENVV